MRQDLTDHRGLLVIFDSISTQKAHPPREELISGMRTQAEVDGGAIYCYSQLPLGLPSSLGMERIAVDRTGAFRGARS